MSDDIVISVENVSKAYRIWNDPGARLRSPLIRACGSVFPRSSGLRHKFEVKASSYYRDFYALRDISFQVRKGESVGIIGRNGSGKSTLLQIIASTLQPTTGSVNVRGRVAALLELGSGFNPDFTGRENVYLNAAVLGLSRTETDAKFDSIAAFADIGSFLEQPVKTYSSGMMMRLAFAVQTAVEPDILIVDEALSVGDAPFQAKCYARMRSLLDRGVCVVLVSHDLSTIRSFCQKVLYLRSGSLEVFAPTADGCRLYEVACMRDSGISTEAASLRTVGHPATGKRTENPDFTRQAERKRDGTRELRLIDLRIETPDGKPRERCSYFDPLFLTCTIESRIHFAGEIQLGGAVRDIRGTTLFSTTDIHGRPALSIEPEQVTTLRMPIGFPVRAGKYYVSVSLFGFFPPGKYVDGIVTFENSRLFDYIEYAAFIEVEPFRRHCLYGPVHFDTTLEIESPK